MEIINYMNLTNEQYTFLIVAIIIAVVIIIKIIFDSRRPIITENPIDPITQRIKAIQELSNVNFLSASQVENLIRQALKNEQKDIKNENSNKG